jgi:hypothetical protein
MKKINLLSIILIGLCLTFSSCEKNNDVEISKISTISAPEVSFNIPSTGYTIYIGDSIDIKPKVVSKEETTHSWIEDEIEISTKPILHYTSMKAGIHIIKYIVTNEGGKTEKTINIEVVDVNNPIITIDTPKDGFSVKLNKELSITAIIESIKDCTYSWKEGNKELSKDKELTYSSDILGKHIIVFTAENIKGRSEKTIEIEILNVAKPTITFTNNKTDYIVKNGETILFTPTVESEVELSFSWTLNNEILATTKDLSFTPTMNGLSKLIFKASNIAGESTADIRILIGLREANPGSSTMPNKVYDYTPAPGQFINEGYTCNNMQEAITLAEESLLNKHSYLSLGGFGGYVVMGFDHSIIDNEKEDIRIKGNSFDGSSEPGIIWVMQDVNANGEPDDTWYQLKGSEYDKPETIKNYVVIYGKPADKGENVYWKDNLGNTGFIEYLIFHRQDSYYPAWIKEYSYTLKGTCLKHRTTHDPSTGYYRNNAYDWGYVDNTDHVRDGNLFEFKNAVDNNGNAVELGFVDFIKVQNGVNVTAGWLGENSTEVFLVEDL